MVGIHGRALNTDEDTLNKKLAAQGGDIDDDEATPQAGNTTTPAAASSKKRKASQAGFDLGLPSSSEVVPPKPKKPRKPRNDRGKPRGRYIKTIAKMGQQNIQAEVLG